MKYEHILWCSENNRDSVWGIILIGENVNNSRVPDFLSNTPKEELIEGIDYPVEIHRYLTVWGRRGAKLQTKIWEGSRREANELARKKKEKGYKPVRNKLNQLYPEFRQDLEKTAVWASLQN